MCNGFELICNCLGYHPKYTEKWPGLCYDGQDTTDPPKSLDFQDCETRCSNDTSCTGFAYKHLRHCYITKMPKKVNDPQPYPDTFQDYTCFKKNEGIIWLFKLKLCYLYKMFI